MTPSKILDTSVNIGNAAIDNDAGIENFVAALGLLFSAEDAAQRGQVQQVTLAGADGQANIGHQQHDEELEETLGGAGRDAVADDETEQVGAYDAQDAADNCTDQPLQTNLTQANFEEYDRHAQKDAQPRSRNLPKSQGL